TKVIGSEVVVIVYGLMQDILGANGLLRHGSPGAVIQGRVENLARRSMNNLYGGGANDVMRDMVAKSALNMEVGARR
ncbi:MAG: acyl-CoA dehydrogenase, partial [Propionibacterium sp.]|nr:acyl-CoA dehydrogenase [Propionibacterium sp.]